MRRLASTATVQLLFSCLLAGPASAQRTDNRVPNEVSYESDIQPIVKNFCTTCHAGESPEGELSLTSYESVRSETEDGTLLKRINDHEDPMPQNGLMPQYMRRMLRVWAETGFQKESKKPTLPKITQMDEFKPPKIVPINIDREGFDLLENMQGHWVGSMDLMGTKFDWMAFDYRAIAPSHVHGIFEGGTMGNLFTSFFATQYQGVPTIMARNGGLLNGIYRTSYFVLDRVRRGPDWISYRLVDAYGGEGIMSMELTFRGNRLEFNAYTSRFGLTEPRAHMAFRGKRMHGGLAAKAARQVRFPQRVIDYPMPHPLPVPTWTGEYPHTSASYLSETPDADLMQLARSSKDPRRIDQMPFLSKLTLQIERNSQIGSKKLLLLLSRDALTSPEGKFITRYGYVREELLDTLLSFPELSANEKTFTFTYLHPGEYFLTVVADLDGDGMPSPGDLTHRQQRVVVKPESHVSVEVTGITVKN